MHVNYLPVTLPTEGARGGRVKEERVLGIKQKLLAEVLRQKEELERKQAARLASKVSVCQCLWPPRSVCGQQGQCVSGVCGQHGQCVASKVRVCPVSVASMVSVCPVSVAMHARTHARTHAHTRTHTHARIIIKECYVKNINHKMTVSFQ